MYKNVFPILGFRMYQNLYQNLIPPVMIKELFLFQIAAAVMTYKLLFLEANNSEFPTDDPYGKINMTDRDILRRPPH